LAAAATVLVLVGGAGFLFQVSEPDAPVADTVVSTTLTDSTPTTVAEQELTNLPGSCDAGSTWSRVCDAAAGFGEALMWGVTAGGPGLVAVGGENYYFYWPEQIDPVAFSGGDSDAVVWTSPDGASWSRVPHTEAVFGGDGEQQMFGVTAGGPGLVAVGFDGTLGNEAGNAAVWTSPDGVTWSRVPHDEAVFGGVGEQRMLGVTSGGPGLVAVGEVSRVFDEIRQSFEPDFSDAAVWTSPDGVTWSRVSLDKTVFGRSNCGRWCLDEGMRSVTSRGQGLVAVGFAGFEQVPGHAAVWTSQDGITWTQVLDSQAAFRGAYPRMFSVTVAGSGLVAVGRDACVVCGDLDAAVWQN
jgi:hypothetical protein